MVAWSIVSAYQFWLNGKTSFLVCRVIIGTLQGGFIPDLILYMSYFFTGKELPFRLALFWLSNRVTAIASPLLAFGLLHLQEVTSTQGWRWLFLVEGLITFTIGCWAWFQMGLYHIFTLVLTKELLTPQ
jgi:sugar phosphate permease